MDHLCKCVGGTVCVCMILCSYSVYVDVCVCGTMQMCVCGTMQMCVWDCVCVCVVPM